MKKRIFAFIIPAFLFALGSCSESIGLSSYPYIDDSSVQEDNIYMGLLETREYSPNQKLEFSVSIDDASLLSYEDGSFKSALKEGKAIATFVSSSLTYKVSVTISKDATVPSFEIENQSLSVYKGATYLIDTSLSYRGVDIREYGYEVKVNKESDSGASKIEVDGESLKVTGLAVGIDTYTIYTEFAGFTLSKSLSVSVKNNEGLVICGKHLIYNNLGPHYTISMYKYSENPIVLKEDIRVLKGGVEVPFDQVNFHFDDPSILSLNEGKLLPLKAGETFFNIAAGGESIAVNVEIYKPVLSNVDFTLSENRFDLDMSVSFVSNKRVFTPSASQSKTIALPIGDTSYTAVAKVVANGQEMPFDSSSANYDPIKKEVALSASLFQISNFGKQNLSVYLEAADYMTSFSCVIDFVTKYIETYADMSTYFVQKSANDVIWGQYVLKNDLDGDGKEATAQYCSLSPVNYSYGFRGIFDGDGHSIKNYKSSLFGFFLVIGNGAVIKNTVFEDVHYTVKESGSGSRRGLSLFGRFISGATLDSLTFKLASDSVTSDPYAVGGKSDSTGLLCTEICTFNVIRNLTFHAEGFDIASVFGKQIPNSIFYNVNIYCKSLNYIGSDQSAVDGVSIHLD